MTDRGLPIVDGAPACPFVAFADDRDERATSPDHRHRCYAEMRPAPRALAHQEAYCLASAFPVCPTFQDWARREAARARSGPAPTAGGGRASTSAAAQRLDPVAGPTAARGDTGAADVHPAGAAATGAAAAGGAMAGGTGPAGPRPVEDVGGDASVPGFLASRDRPGGGLAGSAADRLAASAATPIDDDREQGATASRVPDAPSFLAGGAGPGPDAGASRRNAGEWLDDEVERQDASWADDRVPAVDERRAGTGMFGDRRPRVGDARPRREPNPVVPRDRSRREAYPTRPTSLRMPALGGVGLAVVVLGIAALALFLAPGILRNLGSGSDPGQGPGASPTADAGASPSASPTPSPTPAPSLYVVRPGDTLSAIAARFGITLDQLREANAERLPDPNRLQIGDELIIPPASAPGASGSGASGSAPLP